jgi:hypothetical protein
MATLGMLIRVEERMGDSMGMLLKTRLPFVISST